MKMLNIEKVIDQYGWAYDFVGREQSRYSPHHIFIRKYDDISYDDVDVIYFHSPNIDPIINKAVKIAEEKGIKVIGGYGGNPAYWNPGVANSYDFSNLLVSISPQTYKFVKEMFPKTPSVFLPECIDTNFFVPGKFNVSSFNVGWAGSRLPIKRIEILDKLKYYVIKQSDWGMGYFIKNRPQDTMLKFFNQLNVFVLTSLSECMPRVVLEAMSCGVPVISTNVGSLPLLIDKEWIVPVHPEDEVVDCINKKLDMLKKDPELQKKVGERNRKFIYENYSWEKMQPMWDKCFENLVDEKVDEVLFDNKQYINRIDKFHKHFIG